MGDWPIKEYPKRHFSNQRSYKRRIQCTRAAAAAQGKGKGTGVGEASDSWDDFGSGMNASDEEEQ